MKYLLMLVAALALCPLLQGAEPDFEQAFANARKLREVNLFEQSQAHAVAFTGDFDEFETRLRAPILEEGRASEEQMFGAGVAMGLNASAIGIGFGGWFDVYLTPWLAVGAYTTVSYGIIGAPVHNGGDALAVTLSIGAKFVLDLPDVEVTDWFRPFVVFYPAGFAYFSATEDADIPGTGDSKDVKYSDLFYLIAGGAGIDFYLTNLIGIGFGLYIYGTIGGSEHEHSSGIETETEGAVGVYFEYIRLSLRF